MRFILLISVLCLSNGFSGAQKVRTQKEFSLSLHYHQGLWVPKNEYINYLVQDNISALEVKLAYHPNPEKNWVRQFAVNEVGLAFYQGTLGNTSSLGEVQSISPYIQFSLKNWERFQINTNFGVGIAKMSKYFHPVNNYANLLIGSEYNAHIKLGLQVRYSLSFFDVSADMVFSHFSNGSSKHPNDGLNIITGALGLHYNFGRSLKKCDKPELNSKLGNEFTFVWNQAWKQENEQDPHIYFVSTLNIGFTMGLNAKQRLGGGIDIFYDESVNRGYWNLEPKTSTKDRLSQSFFVAHELVFSRISFITHIGYYTLYKSKPTSSPFYNRLGLRYKFSKHLLANLSLKGHLATSDFIEVGVGYYFNKK